MRSRLRAATLVTMLMISACGEDGATEPTADGMLSAADVSQLARLKATASVADASARFDQTMTLLGGELPGLVLRMGGAEVSRTLPCPEGGSIQGKGRVWNVSSNYAARTVRVGATLSSTNQSCAHRFQSGDVLVLNGGTELGATVTVSLDALTQETMHVTSESRQTGNLRWSRSTGESGQCMMDLTTTYDSATREAIIRGHLCETDVDQTITVPAG